MIRIPAVICAFLLSGALATAETMLVFSGKGCLPCQEMAPGVSTLVAEGWPVIRLDRDEDSEQSRRFNIASIPAIVMLDDDGVEVDRAVGFKTLAQLRQMFRDPHGGGRFTPIGGMLDVACHLDQSTRNFSESLSAVLIARSDSRAIIWTCAHHLDAQPRETATVTFPATGEQFEAELLAYDTGRDTALYGIAGVPGIKAARVFDGDLTGSEYLYYGGFAGVQKWQAFRGVFIAQRTMRTDDKRLSGPCIEWRGSSRPGDSGGPIWTQKGLVGTITASSDGRSIGSTVDSLRHVAFSTTCWRNANRCHEYRPLLEHALPSPPSGPYLPITPEPGIEELREQLAALTKRVAELENEPRQPGEAGPAGPAGPPGPSGPPGKDATAGPPIVVHLLDDDGGITTITPVNGVLTIPAPRCSLEDQILSGSLKVRIYLTEDGRVDRVERL